MQEPRHDQEAPVAFQIASNQSRPAPLRSSVEQLTAQSFQRHNAYAKMVSASERPGRDSSVTSTAMSMCTTTPRSWSSNKKKLAAQTLHFQSKKQSRPITDCRTSKSSGSDSGFLSDDIQLSIEKHKRRNKKRNERRNKQKLLMRDKALSALKQPTKSSQVG